MQLPDRMAIFIIVIFLVSLTSAASLPAHEFFVAPSGNDSHAGSQEKPFRSIKRAQTAVRRHVSAGLTNDVTVYLREGTYELEAPLDFGPDDVGTEHHSVTYAAYPEESVTISGGRNISHGTRLELTTGGEEKTEASGGTIVWKQAQDGIWKALIPGVKRGDCFFRQLFVSGRRATRARMPNSDETELKVRDVDITWQEESSHPARFALQFDANSISDWFGIDDVEVVVRREWSLLRKKLESVDAASGWVVLRGPHHRDFQKKDKISFNDVRPGRFAFFENALAFLDRPGEWYLDRATGMLYYHPKAGEDVRNESIVVPMLTGALLAVRGTEEQPVRNLHFQNISFAHTEFPLPPQGVAARQAADYWTFNGAKTVDSMFAFEFAENCTIRDCAFKHAGGGGVSLGKGVHRFRFEKNRLFDLGANGIAVDFDVTPLLPDKRALAEKLTPRDIRIVDNHIHDIGTVYYGAVGILIKYSADSLVAHNHVHDLPYTGISVGWGWSLNDTPARGNTIEFNHVHHVMKELADGGGIYTLSHQPNTLFRGNLIHDIEWCQYAQGPRGNGFFIDQSSRPYHFEHNIVYSTSGNPVRFNVSHENMHTWGENRFNDKKPDAADSTWVKAVFQQAGVRGRNREDESEANNMSED